MLCLRTAAKEERNQDPKECLLRLSVRVEPISRTVDVSLKTSSSLTISADGVVAAGGSCDEAEQKL